MLLYQNMNSWQSHNISITDKLFEDLEKFKHLSTTTTKNIKLKKNKLRKYIKALKIEMYNSKIIQNTWI
jgi:hypothetical protein